MSCCSRMRSHAVFAFAAVLAFSAVPAWSQAIGTAATVRNDVVQVRGKANAPIAIGEDVVRNEVVKTGTESATKLVFRDDTNLAVGPTSTVTLDRFVFRDDDSASKISVNLVKGAFRFTSGGSEKKAYEIKTPLAIIGVRGTVFDVLNDKGRTIVRLEDGALTACTRSRAQCATLLEPGDTVVITARGVSRTAPGGPGGFTFAAFCGSDGLCATARYAALPANASDFSGLAALCGH